MAARAHHFRGGATAAVEDYVKAIHALQGDSGGGPVGTIALSARLGVTPGSVSAMLKRISAIGLATHVPYRGVRLSEAGERLALTMLRHHRLLELYLAQQLDVPWDRVDEEAERLEHAVSPQLEQRIAAKLGYPTRGLHGDPIPDAALMLEDARTDGATPRRSVRP